MGAGLGVVVVAAGMIRRWGGRWRSVGRRMGGRCGVCLGGRCSGRRLMCVGAAGGGGGGGIAGRGCAGGGSPEGWLGMSGVEVVLGTPGGGGETAVRASLGSRRRTH